MGDGGVLAHTGAMKPTQCYAVLTRNDSFEVLLYARDGDRPPFAEYCGSAEGCERVSRLGVPLNLVFASDEAAADWLLKSCVADIAAVAGAVQSVRLDRGCGRSLAAA